MLQPRLDSNRLGPPAGSTSAAVTGSTTDAPEVGTNANGVGANATLAVGTNAAAGLGTAAAAGVPEPYFPVALDELETPPLPRDHPQWVKDAFAISQRARRILAKVQPLVVRALTFWDHRVRSVLVAGRNVNVDPSGSYKID